MRHGEVEHHERTVASLSARPMTATNIRTPGSLLMRRPVLSRSVAEWNHWMVEQNQPPYRADRYLTGLYTNGLRHLSQCRIFPSHCGKSSTLSGWSLDRMLRITE